MEIKLSPETEAYILDRVSSGDYASVGEVLDAAVQRLRDYEHQLSDEDLQAIEEAEAELAAGKGMDFDVFVAETVQRGALWK